MQYFEQHKVLLIGATLAIGLILVKLFFTKPQKKQDNQHHQHHDKKPEGEVLSKDEARKFILIEKKNLTSGEGVLPVNLYRFGIPNHKSLGLPIGQHISISAKIDDEEVKRSYTPTTSETDKGHFDLVVKIYPKGKMSQHLESLKIGDGILVTGPKGQFTYEKNKYKHIGMLAGGTGITPMLQIIHEIFENSKDDNTKVSFIYGNLSEQDIILREKLESYTKHKNFTVYHVLNNPPKDWKQGSGFITADIISQHCPKPKEGIVLMCGPGPMISAMSGILKDKLGYSKEDLFSF